MFRPAFREEEKRKEKGKKFKVTTSPIFFTDTRDGCKAARMTHQCEGGVTVERFIAAESRAKAVAENRLLLRHARVKLGGAREQRCIVRRTASGRIRRRNEREKREKENHLLGAGWVCVLLQAS
jgi:hypothetical protein